MAGLKTAEFCGAGNNLTTRKKRRLCPAVEFVTERSAPEPVSDEPKLDHEVRLVLVSNWYGTALAPTQLSTTFWLVRVIMTCRVGSVETSAAEA